MKKNNLKKMLGTSAITILAASTIPFSNTFAAEADCFIFDTNTKTITSYSQDFSCTKDVVIPVQINGVDVEVIGANSFARNGITSLKFADGSKVKVVGRNAFDGNKHLRGDFVAPSSLEEIKWSAFGFHNFTNITLNEGLKRVEDYAFGTSFRKDRSLGTLTIPSTLENMGYWSFWSTFNNIIMPEVVSERTNYIVYKNGIYAINKNDKTANLGVYFGGDNLGNEIKYENEIEYKGEKYKVGGFFLSSYSNSVETTNFNNEYDETNLNYRINFDGNTQGFEVHDGILFLKSREANGTEVLNTLALLERNKKELVIKNNYNGVQVKNIGNLTMRDSLLEKVYIEDGISFIDVNAFNGGKIKEVSIPQSAEENVILVAFRHNNLEKISVRGKEDKNQNGLQYLGKTGYGWGDASRANREQYLYRGVVYEYVEANQTYEASYVANLENFELVGEINGKKVTKIHQDVPVNDWAFVGKNTVNIPEGIEEIFYNKENQISFRLTSNVTEVTFPQNSLRKIPEYSFVGGFIKSFDITPGITEIGEGAFASNIGEKEFGWKVVGIVPDGRDINSIINNSNNVTLVSRSEYERRVDKTAPEANGFIEGDKFKVTGLNTGEKSIYKIVDRNQTCVNTIKQATEEAYKIYDGEVALTEADNGKKICVIHFDESYNSKNQEINIDGIDKTAPTINAPIEKEVFIGSSVANVLEGITTSEGNVTDISIVGDYDLNKVGKYTVELQQTDTSGNKATKPLTIVVKEADKSELTKKLTEAKTEVGKTDVINNDDKKKLEDRIKEIEAMDKTNLTSKQIGDLINELNTLISKLGKRTGGSSSGAGGYVVNNDPRVSVGGNNGTTNNNGTITPTPTTSNNVSVGEGMVTVKLVDQLGNEIQPTIVHKGKIGEEYDLTHLIPQLDGYEIKVSGDLKGHIGENTRTGVVYQRLSDIEPVAPMTANEINVVTETPKTEGNKNKVKLPKTGAEGISESVSSNKGLIAGLIATIVATLSSTLFFLRRK